MASQPHSRSYSASQNDHSAMLTPVLLRFRFKHFGNYNELSFESHPTPEIITQGGG